MASLNGTAALRSPVETRHSPVSPASADTQIPSLSTVSPPSSSVASSSSPTLPSSSASCTSSFAYSSGSSPCPSSASAPPSSSLCSTASDRTEGVKTSAVPPAAEATQQEDVASTSHGRMIAPAVQDDGLPADKEKSDDAGSCRGVDENSCNVDSLFARESVTSSGVLFSTRASSPNSLTPPSSNSCAPALPSSCFSPAAQSSSSTASVPSSSSSCVSVSTSLPSSGAETPSHAGTCEETAPQLPSPPSASPSTLQVRASSVASSPRQSSSASSSSTSCSSSAASSRFTSSLSSSPSSSSPPTSSCSSSRPSVSSSSSASSRVAPSAPSSFPAAPSGGVARSTASVSPSSSSPSAAGVAEGEELTTQNKKKKKLSLIGALPHPSRVTALRTAALRQHILERRRQQARDGKAASRVSQPTNPSLFWKEIAVDLDDDGTRCDICGNYDATPEDQILLCDGCDVAAHQTCYGVAAVPEGEWFCQYCAMQRQVHSNFRQMQQIAARAAARAAPRDRSHVEATLKGEVERMEKEGRPLCLLPKACPLCPRRFGAHMQCSEGGHLWVHVNCIVWLPEGWITNVEDCGGMMEVAAWRLEETCSICGIDEGAVVKCAAAACSAVFHPICCLMAGGGMNLTGQIPLRRKNDFSFHAFCVRHRGKAFEESVDAEEPLEFNIRHPDARHPFVRAAHLARRNRDILFYAAQCHKEKSTWGLRMGAYLVRELNENLVAFRMLWQRLADACNTSVPLALPAASEVEEKEISKVGAESSV